MADERREEGAEEFWREELDARSFFCQKKASWKWIRERKRKKGEKGMETRNFFDDWKLGSVWNYLPIIIIGLAIFLIARWVWASWKEKRKEGLLKEFERIRDQIQEKIFDVYIESLKTKDPETFKGLVEEVTEQEGVGTNPWPVKMKYLKSWAEENPDGIEKIWISYLENLETKDEDVRYALEAGTLTSDFLQHAVNFYSETRANIEEQIGETDY